MARQIVIIGAGVVGTALAAELAALDGFEVTVLEREAGAPRGSTSLAPGLVGLYNEAPILTALARESAEVYASLGSGFSRSGGIEIATSDDGAHELSQRAEQARAAGLLVTERGRGSLPGSVGSLVNVDRVVAAWHYELDGTAAPAVLTAALRRQATAAGARFVGGAEVVGITPGQRATVRTKDGETWAADDVVLAAGVWGPTLADLVGIELPLVPVAHPYVYGPRRSDLREGPFLRWPEQHVYGRVHGDRLGLGSYDHAPVAIEQDTLDQGTGLAWSPDLTPAIDEAQQLLDPAARFEPEERVNGVFAVTPDNLPFLGPHPDAPGVWIAQALWVTHAAGAVRMLRRALTGETPTPEALAIGRFAGRDRQELTTGALRLYRDIYANDAPTTR
ncbi:NAD(P)/FAD-dependent oxidoreductase [Promicromonospora sp. NPDC057138]|uniref:NAD(P)/FAD-dependent oxidoreductase n=1 Tax=Promicromonospora sp. NPDC057138 TaxID=3346031 RepID=UPI00363EA960